MNVELLKRTRDAILANAEAFNIDKWGCQGDPEPSCDSPMCISGWAVHLAGGPQGDRNCGGTEDYLDLTEDQVNLLFFEEDWPDQFIDEDNNCSAAIAAARIDHFIATDGRE